MDTITGAFWQIISMRADALLRKFVMYQLS